jgi:hypothetical protein
MVQKTDLQNRNQQTSQEALKRKSRNNFKEVFAAAVRKVARM